MVRQRILIRASLLFALFYLASPASAEPWENLLAQAESLAEAGLTDSARMIFDQAVDAAESRFGPSDSTVDIVLYRGGIPYHRFFASYVSAKDTYSTILNASEAIFGGLSPIAASLKLKLALVNWDLDDYSRSVELSSKALTTFQDSLGDGSSRAVQAAAILGRSYYRIYKLDDAIDILQQALSAGSQTLGSSHTAIALPMAYLANIYALTRRNSEADSLYTGAIDIYENALGRDHEAVASVLRFSGWNLVFMGRHLEAEQRFRRALAIREEIFDSDHPEIAICLEDVGIVLSLLGNDFEAEQFLKQSLAIREKVYGSNHGSVVASLVYLSNLYARQYRYADVKKCRERWVQIEESSHTPDSVSLTQGLQFLGWVNCKLGRFEEAERCLKRALTVGEKAIGPDHAQRNVLPEIYSYLSEMSFDAERYQSAETFKKRQIALQDSLAARGGSHLHQVGMRTDGGRFETFASPRLQLANIYNKLGKLEAAESLLVWCDSVFADIDFAEKRVATLRELGDVRLHRSDTGLAISTLETSLKVAENTPDIHDVTRARVLHDLGSMYMHAGRYEDAKRALSDGLDVLMSGNNFIYAEAARCARSLARIYGHEGNISRCEETYAKYISCHQAFISGVFSYSSEEHKLRWTRKYPLTDYALLTLCAGNTSETLNRLALEMILREKAAVVAALLRERKAAYCSENEVTLHSIKNHQAICTEISNLSFHGDQADQVIDSIRALSIAKDSLESELSIMCQEYAVDLSNRDLKVADVFASLAEGAVLWEIREYREVGFELAAQSDADQIRRYVAVVADRNGEVVFCDLGDADLIDSLVVTARSLIERAQGQIYTAAAKSAEERLREVTGKLAELVFLPPAAVSGGRTDIFIAPDGMLNLIPFEILPIDNDKYVIEEFRISYLSSGKDLLNFKSDAKRTGDVLLFADADFDAASVEGQPQELSSKLVSAISDELYGPEMRGITGCVGVGFHPLPGSRKEVQSVEGLLADLGSGNVFSFYGREAAEERLKSLEQPPVVVHLATHGFFCESSETPATIRDNPLLRSGLVLAGANRTISGQRTDDDNTEDGILTALEVSGLNLVGTELAVLSACESGVGEFVNGEGMFGLRRAFQHAGAETVIMSLWSVPDKETSQLMDGFYRRWLEGKSKRDALRESAIELLSRSRSKRGCGHPLLWGGFILAGNPN